MIFYLFPITNEVYKSSSVLKTVTYTEKKLSILIVAYEQADHILNLNAMGSLARDSYSICPVSQESVFHVIFPKQVQ